MSLELKNINGNTADICEKETGATITTWSFTSPPSLIDSKVVTMSVKKITTLKEAGFEFEEIIKMAKEINIE